MKPNHAHDDLAGVWSVHVAPWRWLRSLVAVLGVFAALAASLAGEGASGVSDMDTLDGLRARIHVGAEFFLDPSHTREDIQRHFARIKETGLSVVRMFFRGLAGPEGWAAILTNSGPVCRVKVGFRGASDVRDVLAGRGWRPDRAAGERKWKSPCLPAASCCFRHATPSRLSAARPPTLPTSGSGFPPDLYTRTG